MDPITFAQLNEAYHKGVYSQRVEEIDKRRAPKELVDRLNASREGHMAQDGPNKPAYDAKQRILKKAHKKQAEMKEELELYDLVSEYLVSEGFCDSYEDADVIMANMSEEWRESILDEARKPISREARSQIAYTADRLGGGSFERNPTQKAKAEKLISRLEKSDKSRGRGELPVGRMARKIKTLVKRPRRSGADKEGDFARAEHVYDVLSNQ